MPLLWLSIAFIAGIITANAFTLPTATWLILAGIALILSILRLLLKRSTFNV
jgi:hypothetical protein